jgi:hypothetical protein
MSELLKLDVVIGNNFGHRRCSSVRTKDSLILVNNRKGPA